MYRGKFHIKLIHFCLNNYEIFLIIEKVIIVYHYFKLFILQAKAVGATTLVLSDGSSTSQFTGGSTGTAATNAEIAARLILIENAINAFTTPECD